MHPSMEIRFIGQSPAVRYQCFVRKTLVVVPKTVNRKLFTVTRPWQLHAFC